MQALDTAQHIQVSSRVLLYDVLHIIWPQRLLKLPLGHEELQDPTEIHKHTGLTVIARMRTFKEPRAAHPHLWTYSKPLKNAGQLSNDAGDPENNKINYSLSDLIIHKQPHKESRVTTY